MKSIFDFPRDPAWLDAQLNNGQRVREFAQHIQSWKDRSHKARQRLRSHLNLAYAPGGNAYSLDIFTAQASRPAPVMVYIHGGYWRAMDKLDYSFVAAPFVRAGACVIVPNYPLCPAVSIEDIVLSQVQALAWIYRNVSQYGGDPQRICVIGHSAGGHLAAMMLACHWRSVSPQLAPNLVKSALSLSGLHDLEPLRHSPYLQGDLKLTAQQVKRCSPAYFPAPEGRLVALCGAAESQEFIRQNRLIQQAWGKQCVGICEEIPEKNHFSVLEALCEPGHAAHQRALELLTVEA